MNRDLFLALLSLDSSGTVIADESASIGFAA